jgi:hypothetical protein
MLKVALCLAWRHAMEVAVPAWLSMMMHAVWECCRMVVKMQQMHATWLSAAQAPGHLFQQVSL